MDQFRDSELEDRYPVTLIVRLVMDPQGQIIKGVLVDAEYTFRQQFLGLAGLTDAMHAWQIRYEEISSLRS